MKQGLIRRAIISIGTALGLIMLTGCRSNMAHDNTPPPSRDINAVLADHDDELLALPGVVGVYVGLMKDQKTTCLKVMLVREDRALESSIPRFLDGYPVITEVTGDFKPLQR